jgi:hypothetical protein
VHIRQVPGVQLVDDDPLCQLYGQPEKREKKYLYKNNLIEIFQFPATSGHIKKFFHKPINFFLKIART